MRARPAGGASWSSAPGSAEPHSATSSPAQSGALRAPPPRPLIPRAAAAAAAERRGPAGRFDVTVLERAPLVGGTALASSAILFVGPLVERAGPGGTCVDPADSVVAWTGHWQYDFMCALQAGPPCAPCRPAQPRPRGAAAAPAPRRAWVSRVPPPRTNWTCLVPPSVLSGHVSSLRAASRVLVRHPARHSKGAPALTAAGAARGVQDGREGGAGARGIDFCERGTLGVIQTHWTRCV